MRRRRRANLLLTEGKTDALIANHLADWHGVPDYYDDVTHEGIQHLLRTLPAHLRESERKRVAVVADADTDPGGRWRSLQGRLAPLGYPVPSAPEADGVVMEAPAPDLARLGIWVMPVNGSPGILEDFLQRLIVPSDSLLPLARSSVAGIPQDLVRFPVAHRPKAEIYTWLAWQASPGCSFGPAIKAGLLDGTQPPARAFISWLRRVFDA